MSICLVRRTLLRHRARYTRAYATLGASGGLRMLRLLSLRRRREAMPRVRRYSRLSLRAGADTRTHHLKRPRVV